MRNKRRIKLINPELQLKIVGIFVGLAGLTIMMQVLLLGFDLRLVAAGLPEGQLLLDALPGILGRSILLAAGMMLPLTLGIGIVVTHRVVGPIYRFEQHLRGVVRGEDMGQCRIRSGDELHELCGLINEALEATAQRARDEHAANEAEEREAHPLRRAG